MEMTKKNFMEVTGLTQADIDRIEMGVTPVRVSIATELDRCPLFEDRETLMRIRAAGERIAEIFDGALP